MLEGALRTIAVVNKPYNDGRLLCANCEVRDEALSECKNCGRKGKTDSQGYCDACDELMAQVLDTQDEYADWDF